MSTVKQAMQTFDAELARVQSEIEKLKIEEAALIRLGAKLRGEDDEPVARKRISNVKPLVIDAMISAGSGGATAADVLLIAKRSIPGISQATVASVLSRLKGDGVLGRDGDRYFDMRYMVERAKSMIGGAAHSLRVN